MCIIQCRIRNYTEKEETELKQAYLKAKNSGKIEEFILFLLNRLTTLLKENLKPIQTLHFTILRNTNSPTISYQIIYDKKISQFVFTHESLPNAKYSQFHEYIIFESPIAQKNPDNILALLYFIDIAMLAFDENLFKKKYVSFISEPLGEMLNIAFCGDIFQIFD